MTVSDGDPALTSTAAVRDGRVAVPVVAIPDGGAVAEATRGATDEPLLTPPGGRLRGRYSRLPVKAKVGLVITGVFVLLAIIGPLVAPYNPSEVNPIGLTGPSGAHLLGTTQTGQDVLSQLLVGARNTLVLGIVAGAIATALSVIFGVTAGYLGGASDEGLSLLMNISLVVPALPLLVVLSAYLHSKGTLATALVVSATGWGWGARVLRAQTLSLRRRDYILAAREAGEPTWRIVLVEILPNETAIIASSLLFTIIFAILTTVGLSFLGLVDPSIWSWGTMLYWAQGGDALSLGAWWWFIPPGLLVALLGMGLALLNFGIDEYSNPKLRTSGMVRSGRGGRARVARMTDPTPVLVPTPSRAGEAAT